MGDVVTVCGQVSSAQKSNDIDLHPTLLGFGQGFPNNNFSVVILEEDLDGFNYNPVDLDNANVCVTGKVVKIFGKPGIFVSDSFTNWKAPRRRIKPYLSSGFRKLKTSPASPPPIRDL
jgi:hypothetical protein